MMEYAQSRFGWENFVTQWEDWAYEDLADQIVCKYINTVSREIIQGIEV
jgi:hypothetical protein